MSRTLRDDGTIPQVFGEKSFGVPSDLSVF